MRARRRLGITLTEVLVALAIFMAGILPLLSLFQGSRHILTSSRDLLHLRMRVLEGLAEARARVGAGILSSPGRGVDSVFSRSHDGITVMVSATSLFRYLSLSEEVPS